MKWIKASERIPGINPNLLWRWIDRSGSGVGYNEKGFRFDTNNRLEAKINNEMRGSIEWLDESDDQPQPPIEQRSKSAYAIYNKYFSEVGVGSGDRRMIADSIIKFCDWLFKNDLQPKEPVYLNCKSSFHNCECGQWEVDYTDVETKEDILVRIKTKKQGNKTATFWLDTILEAMDEYAAQFKTPSLQTAIEKYFIKEIDGKSMLCSRDIQVGDKLTSQKEGVTCIVTSKDWNEDEGDKYYVDLSDGNKGLISTLSDDKDYPPNIINWFKIIGEIIPKTAIEGEKIKEWFEEWKKATKRNGGVLIGSSIKELLTDFANRFSHKKKGKSDEEIEKLAEKFYEDALFSSKKSYVGCIQDFIAIYKLAATPSTTSSTGEGK